MKNIGYASQLLQEIWRQGVREVVVCAGARNAPFVTLLAAENPFEVYSFFEERSASFFALGRMLATQRPVAVITTSGTAVAELLAATIEADYQRLPLWLITADRPRSYRGTAAPQSIVQPGIFSHYVEKTFDLQVGDAYSFSELSGERPVHVNLGFDEPLIDASAPNWPADLECTQIIPPVLRTEAVEISFRRPLVILSGLTGASSPELIQALASWRRPLYIEGHSGLRGHADLHAWEIVGGEKSLAKMQFDGVIRIGRVPTLRFWRDLENSDLPVLHFTDAPFTGLARGGRIYPLSALFGIATRFECWKPSERADDRARGEILEKILAQFPLSEPAWVRHFSRMLPPGARLFVGNSLPIREWDLAAAKRPDLEFFANRGVNGIDGLVSTFLGVSENGRSNWALLGDLSALYDLSGPWALRRRRVQDVNLAVINNGGGKIFERMFHNPLFENRHDLNFEYWARLWDWDYLKLSSPRDFESGTKPRVIEIRPSAEQTEEFWSAWGRV